MIAKPGTPRRRLENDSEGQCRDAHQADNDGCSNQQEQRLTVLATQCLRLKVHRCTKPIFGDRRNVVDVSEYFTSSGSKGRFVLTTLRFSGFL